LQFNFKTKSAKQTAGERGIERRRREMMALDEELSVSVTGPGLSSPLWNSLGNFGMVLKIIRDELTYSEERQLVFY